jgi:hypothetical protein
MFRFTAGLLAKRKLNAYSVFMIQTKNHPDLVGLPIAKRGKKLAQMYKALSPSEMAKLKAKGGK